jgi:hypothetical protein
MVMLLSFSLVFTACQKLDRPELGELVLDPPPPPYEPLKSFWSFEGNANDAGESKLTQTTAFDVTYVPGVTGQAAKFGPNGYLMFKAADTVRYPNGFVGLATDTLRNLGSYTFSFWMNVPGPVQNGAQGVFSLANKSQFWGNIEAYLENHNNAADPSEVQLKIVQVNADAPSNKEQWVDVKIPGVLNKWSHIAFTYDGATSQFRLYANGVDVTPNDRKVFNSGNYGKIRYSEFNGLVLGNFSFETNPTLASHGQEDWGVALKGPLDQFRIYNKALTAAEINTLFTTKQ